MNECEVDTRSDAGDREQNKVEQAPFPVLALVEPLHERQERSCDRGYQARRQVYAVTVHSRQSNRNQNRVATYYAAVVWHDMLK